MEQQKKKKPIGLEHEDLEHEELEHEDLRG